MTREEGSMEGTGGDDGVRDLLGAWALDAVDDVERATVERALRSDPGLAEEGRALREAAADLAWSSPAAAPEALRAVVLDRVARTGQDDRAGSAQTTPAASAPSAASRGRRPGRWVAIAAAAAIAVAAPTALAVRESQRATLAETQLAAVERALNAPGAELVTAEVVGGGRATAVISAGEALFTAEGLPALGHAEDYQIWYIDESGPRPGDVLAISDGRATLVSEIRAGDVLAVTVEPAGGSVVPSSDPVVVLATGA